MKLFTHGFWSGFVNQTNPVNITFFLELFKIVFNENIELCNDFKEADILLESIFDSKTFLFDKEWKCTFLYSGESRLNAHHKKYSCVLYGDRNHDNIINVPLFVPNLYSSKLIEKYKSQLQIDHVPSKNICVIISNDGGKERNKFLDKLEKKINIDYAGNYKNNVQRITHPYNSKEFIDYVSQYKFIISMENSRGDTYITEKILHGFTAQIIPVYWGSVQVTDYFNKDRFINLSNMDDDERVINDIVEIMNDDKRYLDIINKPIFHKNHFERTIEDIAKDIKNLIASKPLKLISQVYAITSPLFEPRRHIRLINMFKNMGIMEHNVSFVCPTYKQTITEEIMNKHVKFNIVKRVRQIGMKKSEISLFLNYRTVLENIRKNYSDGLFIILESDVFQTEKSIVMFNDYINDMYKKKDKWDLIHIGAGSEETLFSKPYCDCKLPYRDTIVNKLPDNYIEDISSPNDKYRVVRKFHTRCTDSFIWTYKGVLKFLDYMETNPYYDAPFDYYITNFFENNLDFKHYWSINTFFIQGSQHGLDISTIQSDKD
jgi:hypothetical protein